MAKMFYAKDPLNNPRITKKKHSTTILDLRAAYSELTAKHDRAISILGAIAAVEFILLVTAFVLNYRII